MYLIDANVVSEARKRDKANRGVIRFFDKAQVDGDALYASVITVGEIRRSIELIRHRGDAGQARQMEKLN
jgi:predicted nucleic acid-binding protein